MELTGTYIEKYQVGKILEESHHSHHLSDQKKRLLSPLSSLPLAAAFLYSLSLKYSWSATILLLYVPPTFHPLMTFCIKCLEKSPRKIKSIWLKWSHFILNPLIAFILPSTEITCQKITNLQSYGTLYSEGTVTPCYSPLTVNMFNQETC